MAAIAEVARLAGVTPSVVSRVLNGDPTLRVRAETRERVVTSARKLDYTPNQAARALRQSRTGVLGLAVHDISNPVYAPLIAGAQQAASQNGYVMMLADVPELAHDERSFARVVGSGAIDGLLLLPAGGPADHTVEKAVEGHRPAVVVNERSRTLPSVGLADRIGMELVTDHLLDLGHQDLVMLRLDGHGHRARQRTEGFTRAMLARGVDSSKDRILTGGHTSASGRDAMRALLRRGSLPTGIVAASVLAAVGAMAAAQEAGVSVPGDLSMVGFHDVFFAEFMTPALTVVRLPLRKLGEVSVERLLAAIAEKDGQDHQVIGEPAPEIVVRGSTAPPAAGGRRAWQEGGG